MEELIDWEYQINKLLDEEIPSPQTMKTTIMMTIKLLENEPNLLHISGHVIIIGDIHG